MSASLYDTALLNKLKNWVKDESMTLTGPDETRRLFTYDLDHNNDKPIQLPLIALRREPTIQILEINKKPMTFDGWRKNNDGNKSDQLNAIPINIMYQIDIYTRYKQEAEEYVRDFVFNIINYPKLSIEIPYNNARLIHDSNIRLDPNISDNSDIPERLVAGQFTRYTISIYIDDAYFFDYRIKDTKKIEATVEYRLVSEDVSTSLDAIQDNKNKEN